MGKRLIIKGADFTANSIDTEPLEPIDGDTMLALLPTYFQARVSLNGSTTTSGEIPASTTANTKRSCVFAADLSDYAAYGYTKITINFTSGFDFVLGIGTTNASAEYYSGDCVAGTFTWVTSSQTASCPLSRTKKYLYINFRYDDNTTLMPTNGQVSDYITSIVLT